MSLSRFTTLVITLLASFGFQQALTAQVQPKQANNAQQVTAPANQTMQILAVVNGQQITRQQIATACLSRFGETVLESMINKLLVLNECKKQNIVITDKDVNDEIVRKAHEFGMTAEKFIDLICTQRKLTVDRYKNDIVFQEMALRRLAQAEIQVAPEELQEQMEFEYGAKVQIREIVTDSREKADVLLQRVSQNPERFGQIAKEHSLNPNSAAVKGLLPPLARHTASPEMEQIVFSMQPGQISNVIEVAGQFLIIKCERIFPAVQINPADLPAIHERLLDAMSESKLTQAATDLFQRMQQTVKIVNVYNNAELRAQMPGVAATIDGTSITLDFLAEECIARFGSPMLTTEINRLLLKQKMQANNLQVTEDDIRAEVTRAAEADAYLNQDGTANIEAWLSFMTGDDPQQTDSLIADTIWPTCALKKLVANEVAVTEDDMRKGFEANYGPRVEALAIVFEDQRKALKVWQMAAANPTEEYFGQLASQYSMDPTSQANFGVIPPIQRYGGKPEMEEEAFSLKAGEISKVIQHGENYVILLCTGRTSPVVSNLEDVRTQLTSYIRDQKTYVAMATKGRLIYEEAQIDNFLEGTSQSGKSDRTAARDQNTLGR